MAWFGLVLACVLLISGGYAAAAEPAPSDGGCRAALPDGDWTTAEIWAWGEICAGGVADMKAHAADAHDCNPAQIAGDVPPGRVLSATFLRLLLTRPHLFAALERPEVYVRCAQVSGGLILRQHHVAPDFGLFDSHLTGWLDLFGARFDKSVYLDRSTLDQPLRADGVQIAGNLLLREGAMVKGDVRLPDAQISGHLSAAGSTVEGAIRADGIQVGGAVFLSDGATLQGGISLIGGQIGGNLFMNGRAAFRGEVDLSGLQIGGNLDAAASSFDDAFLADAAQIGGEVYLDADALFARIIDMTRARIGGNLHLGASRFDGPVVLEWADVSGAILLSSPEIGRPDWGAAAALRWSNATAGAFQGEMPALKQANGTWVPHDLAGFRYERLGGLRNDTSDESLAKAAASDLIAWIERRSSPNWPRPSHDTTYSPQPYMQLADALHRVGATDEARALRYAAREHKRRNPDLAWVDWGLFWLSKLLIGHGIYPFMVLAWFGVLVAAGTIAGAYSCSATLCRFWPRFWFSLENALPLVEPNTGFRAVDHEHRGVEWFFHLQKVLGFVLATIFVGALTLLGGP